MNFSITKGRTAKAQKVVIYGVEGIGKSTLASRFPNPVFIDLEGSTGNMDVARLDKPTSWTMLINEINYIRANPTLCRTIVIDTADWAERLATEYICQQGSKTDITQFGYGEGFIKLETEIGRFLNLLSDLVEIGINVVLTAHAIIKKFEQPDEMGAYDRYELKLGNKTTAKTAALLKEWADMVLFCNYKTHVFATDDKGKKHKAQGGERVMYAEHHPSWDAKNRHGLPFEMPMDYGQIAHIFAAPASTTPQVTQEIPSTPEITNPIPQNTSPADDLPSYIEEPTPTQTKSQEFPASVPQALVDLIRQEGMTLADVMAFSARSHHFPADTPVENIPKEYWEQLLGHWANVSANIKLNR